MDDAPDPGMLDIRWAYQTCTVGAMRQEPRMTNRAVRVQSKPPFVAGRPCSISSSRRPSFSDPPASSVARLSDGGADGLSRGLRYWHRRSPDPAIIPEETHFVVIGWVSSLDAYHRSGLLRPEKKGREA